jgi:HEPN domain-containing protein
MTHAAWMEQAEADLHAAKILSAGGCHSQAVWLAAQAVEKAHKAILFALGLRLSEDVLKKMSHKISGVADSLPESLQEPLDPQVGGAIASLQNLAESCRYPTPAGPLRPQKVPAPAVAPAARISASQVEVDDAEMLVGWCRARVARAIKAVESMRP